MDNLTKARKILRSGIDWLELDLKFDVDVWKQQCLEAQSYYQEYRDNYGDKWSSCCLHGLDIDKTYTADTYGYNEYHAPYQYTGLAYKVPVITDFWKNRFPSERYTRIRFMKLDPGGSIDWHSDGEIPENFDPLQSILPVNVAIIHPQNCEMFVEDKLVPWREGKIIMINISKRHAVFNRSSKDRIHMIANLILGNRTEEFCEMLIRCYTNQYGKI